MARWRAANLRQARDIRARWLFPSQVGALERLAESIHSSSKTNSTANAPRCAIGLFAAAEMLGYGFVRGVAPHLLHEDPNIKRLEDLGLTETAPGERVDVFIRKPYFPETTFRGTRIVDGLPVTDILQVWLDVADYPARGSEMADHL